YRELGEPGKDEVGRKKDIKDVSLLPQEQLGGGVVYRVEGDGLLFAMVHDVFGYWTLSKGHLEKNEDVRTGTQRELNEELGLNQLEFEGEIGVNEYIASDPKIGPVRRKVTYFLVETPESKLKLGTSGGLDDIGWFSARELAELKIYPDIRPILEKAINTLQK
ncbi:MAG: NUDIX domain-containing protein, partial [Patescibacteria group bacterium]